MGGRGKERSSARAKAEVSDGASQELTSCTVCSHDWSKDDGAVAEPEAGGMTPSLEGCVHVANERQWKQNTGIVFCKSQIHVLLPFSFSPKLKIGH